MNQIEKAIVYATKAHEGQKRKNSDEAYVEHTKRVANILQEAGFRDEVVIAGVLHDTVEDTFVTIEDIRDEFGEDVAKLVNAHTEDKTLSWEERKEHTISVVQNGLPEVQALIVADKLDNLQSVKSKYDEIGERVWDAFKRGKEQQAWYNRSVLEAIKGVEEAPKFFQTYKKLVESFYK